MENIMEQYINQILKP